MKRFFSILLLALAALTATAQTISYNGIKQDVVIDVRTAYEYQAGHIAGAINVPLSEIETGIYQLQGVNKNSQILVYCRSGRRSAMARHALVKHGFQHVYDGGAMKALSSRLKLCHTQHC